MRLKKTLNTLGRIKTQLASGVVLAGGLAMPIATPVDAAPDNVASGVVFSDKNANGVRDSGEPGIPGVSVSNGVDVVQTKRGGRYEIALPPESVLFITKPPNYDVPVDENNLPQFFYIHYPDGTPDVAEWDFNVIKPTGPLPEKINFPLLKSKTKPQFNAMAFADTQAGRDDEQDMIREDVVNELIDNPFGALFGITVGDVVNDNLGLYPRHNAMMGLLGIPMWNVPGNHDLNFRAPSNDYATQTFIKTFGPDTYSFEYGRIHVLAINNVEYKGDGQGRFDNTVYRGYITDKQLKWIANDLSFVDKDKLIVIATHIPLVTYALDGQGERFNLGDNINTKNLTELLELLEPFKHIYAMAGHDTSNSWKVEINHTHGWHGTPWIAHTLAEVRGNGWTRGPRDERDVRAATMQDGNPNGYYLMKFDGHKVKPRFIPAGQKRNVRQRMRIVLDPLLEGSGVPDTDERIAINRGNLLAGTRIVVNLFDGGERDSVWLSLDNGPFKPMNYIGDDEDYQNDPFMVRQFEKFQDTDDSFSSPQPSSHLWEQILPDNLASGLHKVVVKSRDEFGQRARDALSFEVLD